LDSYTPLPETLEAIKDLFCHPEDFSPDFPRVSARARNQDTAGAASTNGSTQRIPKGSGTRIHAGTMSDDQPDNRDERQKRLDERLACLHLEIQEQRQQMDEADRLERWRIRGPLKAFDEYLGPRSGPPPQQL
jgi:hypothetical protein